MMKAIIFGIHGQDGYYLNELLIQNNVQVIGVSRSEGDWIPGSVSNRTFVEELIKKHQPDYIFHLAANSTRQHSALFENHETISTGTINILESVYKYSQGTKVFLAGSCLQFMNDGKPINEFAPFNANDVYSAERIYSVYLARYFRQLGLKIYVGYLFHHDSPFRSERHISMAVVCAAKRIKNGSNEIFEIGNPDVIKEFNHAKDLMRAVWILVNQEDLFETVIGCGVGHRIGEWITTCFRILGLNEQSHIKLKEHFKSDFSVMVSSPESIMGLGWVPEYNMADLAHEMMNHQNKIDL